MIKLFLDDERRPPDNTWRVVRSLPAFTAWIETNGMPDLISFDHDLSTAHYRYAIEGRDARDLPDTGYACALWLLDYHSKNRGDFPATTVHSMNPVGAENIRGLIKSYLSMIS